MYLLFLYLLWSEVFSSTCMERVMHGEGGEGGGEEIQNVKEESKPRHCIHPKQTVFKNNSGDGN